MINAIPDRNKKSQKTATKFTDSLWLYILLLVVFSLGIIFRFSRLGYKIYSHDEAYTSLRAAGYYTSEVFSSIWDGRSLSTDEIQKFLQPAEDKNVFDTLAITATRQPHQAPLYFILSHYWMRLVGYTPAAMRSLALIFSLICIPGMYWLSEELFQSRRIALLSAILITLSPFHILYAQDARPYSLWALFTILSSAALLRAMRIDNKINWGIYALALVIGIYSHQLFALVAIVHLLYFVSQRTVRRINPYAGFVSASFPAFVAYTPWLYNLILHWENAKDGMDWVYMPSTGYRYIQRWLVNFTSPFIDLEFTSGNLIPYLLRGMVSVFIAFSLLFLVLRTPRRVWLFLVLIIFVPSGIFILPDILLGGIRSIGGRYFVPANIASILSVAYLLGTKLNLENLYSRAAWRLTSALLLLGGILSGINIIQAETWWNKELSRVQPEFAHVVNQPDRAVLIVSGYSVSRLGDVFTLSLDLDPDVRIRLYQDPTEIEFSSSDATVFWYPRSPELAQEVSQERHLRISEVIPQVLWRIDSQGN